MKYKDTTLGFSFELPASWRHEEDNSPLTFLGPEGRIGKKTEVIQIRTGTILPDFINPEKREAFMSEPGATLLRGKLGNERNSVVVQKEVETEITAVHDGMHYTIAYSNDETTLKAMEMLTLSFEFPTFEQSLKVIEDSE